MRKCLEMQLSLLDNKLLMSSMILLHQLRTHSLTGRLSIYSFFTCMITYVSTIQDHFQSYQALNSYSENVSRTTVSLILEVTYRPLREVWAIVRVRLIAVQVARILEVKWPNWVMLVRARDRFPVLYPNKRVLVMLYLVPAEQHPTTNP